MPPAPNVYHPAGIPNPNQLPPPVAPVNQNHTPVQAQAPLPIQPIIGSNNKLTPNSRVSQLPPTFGSNVKA